MKDSKTQSQQNPNKIKLITFDLDNTLWSVDPVIKNAEIILRKWLKDNHSEAAILFSDDTINKIRKDILLKEPLIIYRLTDFRKKTIKHAFLAADYSEKNAIIASEKAFEIFYDARNQVNFFPDVINTLKTLSEHYLLGSLSNGNACIKKTGLDTYISFHFSAEHLGQPKPHPAMFEAAMKEAKALPHECIHIGDHPEQDILAAEDLGLSTIWANMFGMAWPYKNKPTFEITHFDQLVGIIKSIDID